MKLFKFSFLILLFVGTTFTSCIDDDFDTPPDGGIDPDIEANTTIAELLEMHTIGGFEEITTDIIIQGIVIADDRSGNFFRQIIIQDSTGGIELRMNETELYNEYGIGRQLFVKCNRMWLGDYNGTTQLGSGTELDDRGRTELSQIPSALFDEHIVKGRWGFTTEPTVKTVSGLREGDINTLVKIENVQFALEDCNRTYAIDYTTPEGNRVQESRNQPLDICSGSGEIVVRSSGYSSFATQMLPTGSGSITAVYTVFGDTKQLIIRDPSDVDMNDDRCGNSGVSGELRTIAEMQSMYNGTEVTISSDFKISGIVISDYINENITRNNLVIQDESGGIIIRFTEPHAFGLGEIMDINVQGAELSEFNGGLQINNVELTQAFSTCNIGTITPRVATIAELNANIGQWENTLVQINMANISGGPTYSGSSNVSDATGSVNMFTQFYASFADAILPTGPVDTIVAILSFYNGVQLNIRNTSDIKGGEIVEPDPADISQVRDLFNGTALNIPNNWEITGVVVSDGSSGNIPTQNLVLQDGDAGIIVRFDDDHNYAMGDQLTININGQELSVYRTLLQLNNVPISAVTEVATGTMPNPRIATVAEILANGEAWESTLVTIQDATITGSSTYAGNTTVSDATGGLTMYTRNQASFASTTVPSGMVNITGYIGEFDSDRQIGIRNLDDVK